MEGTMSPGGQRPAAGPSRILILDYGSQFTQLIARRVREARVYSEIHPPTRTLSWIREWAPTGIILSGGPNSVYGDRFSQLDLAVRKTFSLGAARLQTAFDLYNALNGNSIQNVNTAYTPTGWLKPQQFLDARVARVTASIQF